MRIGPWLEHVALLLNSVGGGHRGRDIASRRRITGVAAIFTGYVVANSGNCVVILIKRSSDFARHCRELRCTAAAIASRYGVIPRTGGRPVTLSS